MAVGEAPGSVGRSVGRRIGDPAGAARVPDLGPVAISNRSGNNGPSRAKRRAQGDGSIAGPDAADDDGRLETRTDDSYGPEPYCAVTIVAGRRQLDVALPTTVRLAELLPELLRLLLPGELPPDEQSVNTHPWVLTSIGGMPTYQAIALRMGWSNRAPL